MPRETRTLFEREPEGEHRRQPEKDRQRINRHEEGADVEDRCGVDRKHRPEPGVRAEQSPRKVKQQQARPRSEHRTEKSHAELIRAENRSARAHHEGEARALDAISRRQALRTRAISSFMETTID